MKSKRPDKLFTGLTVALALLGGVAWSDWRHIARMTSSTGEQDSAACCDLEANSDIRKSVDIDQLNDAIRKAGHHRLVSSEASQKG
jgi:hypothetical protein